MIALPLYEHDLESSQKSKLWEPKKFKPHKTFYIKQTWKIIMDIGSFFLLCVCFTTKPQKSWECCRMSVCQKKAEKSLNKH